MKLALKFKAVLTKEQQDQFFIDLNASRFIWNHMIEFFDGKINKWSLNRASKLLTEMKKLPEYEFLKKASRSALTQKLADLDNSFKAWWKWLKERKEPKRNQPSFKEKFSTHSARYQDLELDLQNKRIKIPKCSWISIKITKKQFKQIEKMFEFNPKMITISINRSGDFYASWCTDYEPKKSTATKSIGIDLGITNTITMYDSDGNTNILNLDEKLKKSIKKTKRLAKKHSKKQIKSRNKEKVRKKLTKAYQKETNIKLDFYHKTSKALVNENQVICIEDLNIAALHRSNVSKSIQRLSLSLLRNQLKYKSEMYGAKLVLIDRFFPSSKLCSACGYKNTELKRSDKEWICPSCGTNHHRDINAAKNILSEGIRLINNKIPIGNGEFTSTEISALISKVSNCSESPEITEVEKINKLSYG